MPETSYRYEIEVRRPPGGDLLGRAEVDEAYLQPLREDILWRAQREGHASLERSRASWEIRPILRDGGPRVEGLRLRLVQDGAAGCDARRDYPLRIFAEPARPVVERLIEEKRLRPEEEIQLVVTAREIPPATAGPARAAPRFSLRQSPLPLVPGLLEEFSGRSRRVNPHAGREGDMPVFMDRPALEEAFAFSRRGGSRESGCFLVGRLFRQEEPEPEIFASIEGALEARNAREEIFSLALTTETYLDFQRELSLLRERLGRPEVILLGTAHGHNFLPSLDEGGARGCPDCPSRATCGLDSAFFSARDREFHQAVFAKKPFGVGLVWGFDPREQDVLGVYGFRDGTLQERSLSVLE